jgi:hypothetical protein
MSAHNSVPLLPEVGKVTRPLFAIDVGSVGSNLFPPSILESFD